MTTSLLALPDVAAAPEALPFPRRILKHPRLVHYNRLVVLAMTVNLGWAVYGVTTARWWTSDGADLGALALVAQTNLAAAVVFRQQYVFNALAWLMTRPPTSWPLRVRWALGKYYHFGGLHVGTAVAGTLWYLILVVSMIRDAVAGVGEASSADMILGLTIATTFTVRAVMALPRLRAKQHDRFEVTHRFCGWAALVLIWINTMLVDGDLLTAPAFWLVVLSVVMAVWPWLLLRRVPISYERPSSHAVVLRLDHGAVPAVGTTRPISRRPGPVLSHLLDTSVPSRLVWVTKNPRLTYGEAFVDEIDAAQPDALIWDTGLSGKPDVLQLAYDAYVESGAEAVICVANRTVTREVVHGLERCGIPAFGPIWDS